MRVRGQSLYITASPSLVGLGILLRNAGTMLYLSDVCIMFLAHFKD